MQRPLFVKLCCISSVDEARLAVELGASGLGWVSLMPSGPGVIDDDLIAEIAASVPPPIATFLLTAHLDKCCDYRAASALSNLHNSASRSRRIG